MTLFNLGDTSYAHETIKTSNICHMFNMQIQSKIIIQVLFNGDFTKKIFSRHRDSNPRPSDSCQRHNLLSNSSKLISRGEKVQAMILANQTRPRQINPS